MPHTCHALGLEQLGGGRGEEVEHGAVVERRRVGYVDNQFSARQSHGEALDGDRVYTCSQCGRHCLVSVLPKPGDKLRADESGTADYYDLHCMSSVVWSGHRLLHQK